MRLSDLPALKRFRAFPEVQKHLRHPHTSWWGHLWWFWRTKTDPTMRVWTVTRGGGVIGLTGFYYRKGGDAGQAEFSVLCCDALGERYEWEREAGRQALVLGRLWGLMVPYVEVLVSASVIRHALFLSLGFEATQCRLFGTPRTDSAIYYRTLPL